MAGTYDLVIEQAATFQVTFTWQDASANPVNLTGYTAKADVRDAAGTLLASLTTANGGIVLGGVAGTIALTLPPTTTQGLPVEPAQWDLFLTAPAGTVTRLLAGNVTILPQVTQ